MTDGAAGAAAASSSHVPPAQGIDCSSLAPPLHAHTTAKAHKSCKKAAKDDRRRVRETLGLLALLFDKGSNACAGVGCNPRLPLQCNGVKWAHKQDCVHRLL